jgi:hypothetical protein
MDDKDFNIGDRVHYKPDHYGPTEWENGIVKHVTDRWVFVVYRCSGEWDRYEDYTAAATDRGDLRRGWR